MMDIGLVRPNIGLAGIWAANRAANSATGTSINFQLPAPLVALLLFASRPNKFEANLKGRKLTNLQCPIPAAFC
jgi:hypothetical protein